MIWLLNRLSRYRGALSASRPPCWATGGTTTNPSAVNTATSPAKTIVTDRDRRSPRRFNASTRGLRARVRKNATSNKVMT